MKAKLTVTVDQELISEAKRYAKQHGVSLSRLIESFLRDLTAGAPSSFSQRWRGTFKPADKDGERYQALAEKYLS